MIETQGPSNLYLATYIGGSGDDRVLAIDNSGYQVAVAGSTNSVDFPLANGWQTLPGGGMDGFLTIVGANLQLSTYLGGSGDDQALAVSFAPSGTDFYLAGTTTSTDRSNPEL